MTDWDKLMDPARNALEALIARGDEMADRIEELEAKLAKAVELALEECPFRHGTPKYNDWWHHRSATLAEISCAPVMG